MPRTIEARLDGTGLRFAIVVSRFNAFITEPLLAGAVDVLTRHGVADDAITVVKVPGAMEVSLACLKAAKSSRFDAVVALSAVIRGGTPHFDYVCADVTRGVGRAQLDTGVPVGYGILTVNSIEQAIERAGTKAGNKGAEAAMAALEMAALLRQEGWTD